jgi:glycosyltransferase involved in cell wall biosynthesis
MRLKKRYGLKCIFDMRGFWVDERIEGGIWNIRNPLYAFIYKFFKRKEMEFVRHADRVIVLTGAAKEELLRWNLNEKISIIPCCVDLEIFDPGRFKGKTKNEIRAQLNLPLDDYTLLYLGSLGTWYLYPEMVSFFRQLKKIRPSAKFLFLTPDVDRVGVDPDFIVRTVAKQEVPMYILASDASVCFIKPSFSKKGSSATKMAEVLAMGVPLVANAGWGDIEWMHQNIRGLYVIEGSQDVPTQLFDGAGPGHRQELLRSTFRCLRALRATPKFMNY